jgi:hypothetical protein
MGEKLEKLVGLLSEKAVLKQDVFQQTSLAFDEMKTITKAISEKIKQAQTIDHNKVQIDFEVINAYEFQLKVGSDIIVFMMKTNVFALPADHKDINHKYLKKDWKKGYFGQIVVYDFIADSVKFNRVDDIGYLIERIFINIDNHYLVEGLQNIAYRHPDINKNTLSKNKLEQLIEEAIYVSIDTDLVSTSYAANFNMTIEQRLEKRNQISGAKVGFQMSTKND